MKKREEEELEKANSELIKTVANLTVSRTAASNPGGASNLAIIDDDDDDDDDDADEICW